jgi:hypothetical protein
VKVTFESQVNWYAETNILRTHSSFHGHSQHGSILVDTSNGPSFAKLIFMFSIAADNCIGEQKLALIRYYVPSKPQPSDTIIGYKRVSLQPPSASQILSLESLIRGAYVAPAFGSDGTRSDEYYVNDLIDDDMFVCLRRQAARSMHR